MKAPNDPKKLCVNFNISDLRAKDEQLYKDIIAALGEELTGEVSLSHSRWWEIPVKVRDRLSDYLYDVNPDPKAHLAEEPPKPQEKPWSEHDLKFCTCQNCFQERARQQQVEQQRLAEEQKPGQERLLAYMQGRVPGFTKLLNNDFNGALFSEYINDPALDKTLIIEPRHIDAFIVAKKSELLWTLPNGEEQLPLDTDEATMRRASIIQLRDLSKRRGEGQSWLKRGKAAGWFGANIDTGRQSQVV